MAQVAGVSSASIARLMYVWMMMPSPQETRLRCCWRVHHVCISPYMMRAGKANIMQLLCARTAGLRNYANLVSGSSQTTARLDYIVLLLLRAQATRIVFNVITLKGVLSLACAGRRRSSMSALY